MNITPDTIVYWHADFVKIVGSNCLTSAVTVLPSTAKLASVDQTKLIGLPVSGLAARPLLSSLCFPSTYSDSALR